MSHIRTRIQTVIGILNNFKELRDGVHSRSEYVELLKQDLQFYFGYTSFLIDKILQLFPPSEVINTNTFSFQHIVESQFCVFFCVWNFWFHARLWNSWKQTKNRVQWQYVQIHWKLVVAISHKHSSVEEWILIPFVGLKSDFKSLIPVFQSVPVLNFVFLFVFFCVVFRADCNV